MADASVPAWYRDAYPVSELPTAAPTTAPSVASYESPSVAHAAPYDDRPRQPLPVSRPSHGAMPWGSSQGASTRPAAAPVTSHEQPAPVAEGFVAESPLTRRAALGLPPREPAPAPAPQRLGPPPTASALYDTAKAAAIAASQRPTTRRALRQQQHQPKTRSKRPILAGALAVSMGGSALGYAAASNLQAADAAFVVGDGVAAQTAELSRATTVDTTYRAAASVSRNERRTAIVAADVRDAAELERKRKAEAKRLAEERAEKKRLAELEAMREKAIANARSNPQAAARVLMVDHGWTSDAQYNCLVNLWNGESGWRYTAENPSSGAYGIPQSLPGSKMGSMGSDWRTNPITQIKWGLWYIGEVYGSPCNAWSTWLSRSPHWY